MVLTLIHRRIDQAAKPKQYQRWNSIKFHTSRPTSICLRFNCHQTVSTPTIDLSKPVYSRGQENSSSNPSMKYIQPFIRYPSHISDKVIFAGEENDERELCHREQRCTKRYGFIMLSAFDVVVIEFESQNKGEIEDEHDDRSERRYFYPI